MTHLVVIVPAWNEDQAIGPALAELEAELVRACGACSIDFDIVVVDDGSDDATATVAAEFAHVRVLRHKVNRGLGAAVRSGLVEAARLHADLVVKIDADGQHDPGDIERIIAPLLSDEADLVYGDRWAGMAYRMPRIRQAGNVVFTGIVRLVTGWPIRDAQPGIFAMNKECLELVDVPGRYNYTQQVLISAYLGGMRFGHVPVAFRRRDSGQSFISWRYPLKVIPQILMVLIGVKPLKVFSIFAGIFLGLCALVALADMATWLTGSSARVIRHVNFVLGCLIVGVQAFFSGLIGQLMVNNHRQLLERYQADRGRSRQQRAPDE